MAKRTKCECGRTKRANASVCDKCSKALDDARYSANEAIVRTNTCPLCGNSLVRNYSLTGWYQCAGFGAEGFRKANSKPCNFQTFTRSL